MNACAHESRAAIRSSQQGPHPRLDEIVARHRDTPWRAPLHLPSCAALQRLRQSVNPGDWNGVVLDSGCGAGTSTRAIARAFPDALVVGIDRSQNRLRHIHSGAFPYCEGNAVWIRAELSTFWRLVHSAGWPVLANFLLYPNPWPKAVQLKRRWHAHPVFPTLMSLGGVLELRTNWRIYAEEFARAAWLIRGVLPELATVGNDEIDSPFGQKYRARGEPLFAVRLAAGSPG